MATMRYILVFLVFRTLVTFANGECTSVCKCSGYKAADCTDKDLIMIPDGIDGETLLLNMTGNNLQILSRDTFQKVGLVNLQHLHLTSCRLGQIDDHAFRGLTNLIKLYLNRNLLTSVPSHTFVHVPNLKLLDLSRNPIQKLDPFSFRLLPNLSYLYLADCNLQWIGPKAFDGLDALIELGLNNNQLAGLPAVSMMNTLHRLQIIELHDNPWKCDCYLRATKVWLADKSTVSIYCIGGPERLKGRSILELSADDFACMPSIKIDHNNNNRPVEAIIGNNASLECRVESDPVAKISWYRNGVSLSNYSLFNSNSRTYISQTGENIYDMRSKLIITNVESADNGQYKCVAENKAGKDEAYFALNAVPLSSVRMSVFNATRLNTLTVAFAVLIVFMLIVIVLLIRRLRSRRASSSSSSLSTTSIEKSNNPNNNNHNNDRSNSPASSNNTDSRDSVYKSESGKAFTITSDLSYSRSLSDVGSNPRFSNPDLIMHHRTAGNSIVPSNCETILGDYAAQHWQRSYDGTRNCYYETNDSRFLPVNGDTISAGSIADEVLMPGSRISNDYPPDYGLPILPENGTLPQPCVKTLKVWQKGVPVYPPPVYSTLQHAHHLSSPQQRRQYPHLSSSSSLARNSPADPRCGTDV